MMRAEIDIDNPLSTETGEPLLKPGSYGNLHVTLRQHELPAVKRSAVKRTSGRPAVMVVTPDNICLETPITIAMEGDTWVGIASGISEGVQVVSKEPGKLQHRAVLNPAAIRRVE